jgi:amino-acid N-acetyltransferase
VSASPIHARPPLAAAAALLAAARLPTEDLTEAHCEHFFYCGPATAPVAVVGLELLGDTALLRSLVVTPQQRSRALGSTLVEHAERHARAAGARALYLLTTTAEEFFARRGYRRVERATAPAAIRNTREFAGICPASSAFMCKSL